MGVDIKIDVSKVDSLADRLGRISSGDIGLGASRAVNTVTTRFMDVAMAGEIADINLEPTYVKSKTDLKLSTPGPNPRAEITTRGDLTILGRYQPVVQLRKPSTRKARYGPRRGRPIGTTVKIRRSGTEEQPKWFTMRLRAGAVAGSNVGVFIRLSKSKTKHIYGPSPYSLFRHQIVVRQDDVSADLQASAVAEIGGIIERNL